MILKRHERVMKFFSWCEKIPMNKNAIVYQWKTHTQKITPKWLSCNFQQLYFPFKFRDFVSVIFKHRSRVFADFFFTVSLFRKIFGLTFVATGTVPSNITIAMFRRRGRAMIIDAHALVATVRIIETIFAKLAPCPEIKSVTATSS